MRNINLHRYFLILAVFLFHVALNAQPGEADQRLEQIMQQDSVMGLAVVVVKNNQIIYTKNLGYKDREAETLLGPEDIFRIASISKSFTVTSLMQQVKKRKVKLSDDVSDLVGFKVRNPLFPEKVITLGMLLSHQSSINDSEGYFSLDYINPDKNPNWKKCYNNYEPGTEYQYCNLNFNLAGTILERISGQRFDRYVVEHVLQPLGLYGGYNVNDLDANRFAKIYEYQPDKKVFVLSESAYASRKEEIKNYQMGYSAPIFSPTGGMKISAIDLAKYMLMHMNYGKGNHHRIIKKKYAKLMQEVHAPKSGYGYALLQSTNLIPGKTMVGHTGSAYGLFSAMFFEPKEKFGIVVISNGCDPAYKDGFNAVSRKAIEAMYETLIK